MVGKTDQLGGIIQNGIAAHLTEDPGEIGIGLQQPAPERDSVGFVDDPVRIHRVQVAEHGFAHQVGVKRRHAVDAMGPDKRKVPHSQPSTIMLIDQRNRPERGVGSGRIFQLRCLKMLRIDAIDDLQVPRQNAPEQIDRPGFERFRQQRMVGVGECADRDTPRLVPRQAVKVDEDAHEFRNCDARMRVIELDCRSKRQEVEVSIGPQMPLHQVLQRG